MIRLTTRFHQLRVCDEKGSYIMFKSNPVFTILQIASNLGVKAIALFGEARAAKKRWAWDSSLSGKKWC